MRYEVRRDIFGISNDCENFMIFDGKNMEHILSTASKNERRLYIMMRFLNKQEESGSAKEPVTRWDHYVK